MIWGGTEVNSIKFAHYQNEIRRGSLTSVNLKKKKSLTGRTPDDIRIEKISNKIFLLLIQ